MSASIKKSIQLTTKPFEDLLAAGESIDFRLDEPQWADLQVGDLIEFWEDFSGWDESAAPQARRAIAQIKGIFKAASFQDLLDAQYDIGRTAKDDANEIVIELRNWWSEDKERQTGVIGFKVKLEKEMRP